MRHFFATALLALVFVMPALAEVVITQSTASVCQWTYQPGRPLVDRPDSVNARGVILDWEDTDIRISSDLIQPVRVFNVVVPPGTTPRMGLLSRQTAVRDEGLPGRSPWVPAGADRPHTEWAQLTDVSVWRGYRIARIEVALQIGDERISEVLERLTLTVVFDGQPSLAGTATRDAGVLSSIALNGREAATWWEPERPARTLGSRLDEWPEFPLFRLAVEETGIYRITGSTLRARGADLVGRASSSIKLFGNGGGLLPKLPDTPTDSVLKENSILVFDGGDGTFDESDSILFYGRGVKGFDYADSTYLNDLAHQNPFTKENIYFIGSDPGPTPGLRMEPMATTGGTPISTTAGREYVDSDQFIYSSREYATESGLIWYMHSISPRESRTVAISADNAISDSAWLTVELENRPALSVNDSLDIYLGDVLISPGRFSTFPFRVPISPGVLGPGSNNVRFVNRTPNVNILINYLELEFSRRLAVSSLSGALEFYSPVGQTGTFEYTVEGLNPGALILDVTNPLQPRVAFGNTASDAAEAGSRRTYYAVNSNRLRTPLYRGAKPVNGGADYRRLRDPSNPAGLVIVTHDAWFDILEPLKQFHESYREEPLPTVRVSLTDIYDEFGWGVRDVVAIRNFLEYAYENWRGSGSDTLRYVLFVGDGDYDYRNLVSPGEDNWMPPWEWGPDANDDFFATFDNADNARPQLFTGRWPLQTPGEVEAAISKTIAYANEPLYSPWKNSATFAADDEWKSGNCYETEHTVQAESLIRDVLPSYFSFNKVYEIFYPLRATPTGMQKPDATRDLLDAIRRGTLIVDYRGHGNERIWSDEQLFIMDRDHNLLDNHRKWPLFVAATCSWGGFDRVGERCFPELLLADERDGAIASLGATRVTFSNSNNSFSIAFYRELFRPGLTARRSFGEALTIAKWSSTNTNPRLYHVLGNPVLRLATPEHFARVTARDDSMQALSLFHLSGVVSATPDGDPWTTFNGVVEARIFDTQDSSVYYWPDPARCDVRSDRAFYYSLEGNAIFRGTASVRNGQFDVTFRVPRDVRYGGTNARVSLYFYGKDELSPDSADGIGIEQNVLIANEAASESDSIAPTIMVWLESPSFRSGDLVGTTPRLHVDIADSSGINLSGEVGHRITVRVDDAATQDLTQYFNYHLDSYTTGSLEKAIGPLTPGEHRLLVEAWDSFNNLNQATVTFVVGEAGEAGYDIRDVLNWPNPMNDVTHFTYYLTQEGTREVNIKVYTLSGKLVWESSGFGTALAFNSNAHMPWDGRDREGHMLGNGVYLYKVRAKNASGTAAESTGKLVILR